MKRFALLALLVIVLFSVIAPAALAQDGNPVQAAAQQYFAGGTKNIKAADLFANLNDGDASNDPFMVDIRAPEDYANGHIPGAINIPGKVLFTADGLAKLPKDKQIVLNCYSGQTASQSTAALRMMGYDAYNLLYGVPVLGHQREGHLPLQGRPERQLQVQHRCGAVGRQLPAPAPLGDTVEAAAMAYFPGGFKAMKAADVFANLNDGDDQQRPRHPGRPQCRRLCARSHPRRGQCLAQDPVHHREPGQAARRQADRFLLLLRPDRQPGRPSALRHAWATMPTTCSSACPPGRSSPACRSACGM